MKRIVRVGGHRLRRHVRQLWMSRGGGFYGFVGALTFVYLEARDLIEDIAALPALASLDLGVVISFVVGNLIDAIGFFVAAALWPVEWIGRFGISLLSGALLLAAYTTFRLIRPTVLRLLEVDEDEATEPVS